MRKNKYLVDLVVQFIIIGAVISIFKLIEDRKVAALIAGLVFLIGPAILAVLEFKIYRFGQLIWWIGFTQFYVLFSLPIFLGRILNWELDFEKIALLGVPLTVLHRFSNSSYMLMIATTAFSLWQLKKKKAA